eukprot:gene5945-9099_t
MDIAIIGGSVATLGSLGLVAANFMIGRTGFTGVGRMRANFAFTFALSCMLMELIIFEILGILGSNFRHQAWHWTLVIALINLIVIIPIHTCYTFSTAISAKGQGALTLTAYAVFLVGFILLEQERSLSRAISRIGVFGVATIALLSGTGAVYTPFHFLHYFRENVSQYQIDLLEDQLRQSRNLLSQKEKQRSHRLQQLSNFPHASHKAQSRKRFLFWTADSQDDAIDNQLDAEISALKMVNTQMEFNLQELKQVQLRFEEKSSLKGRIQHVIGLCLSVYCAFKVVTAIISVSFSLTKKTDAVTRLLGLVVAQLGLSIDVNRWSQQISFILVGMIVVASTRNLLLKMWRTLAWLSPEGNLRGTVILLLVQIMGMYFVSMVILMRMNLPLQYRPAIIIELWFAYNPILILCCKYLVSRYHADLTHLGALVEGNRILTQGICCFVWLIV